MSTATLNQQSSTRKTQSRVTNFALKMVMAVTGVIFALFVLVHMFGNLKVFQGAEAFNHYAHWLREALYPLLPKQSVLWALRVVLLVSLIGHVSAAAILTIRGRKARGPHRRKGMALTSFTARTMPVTGIVLFCFIIFHILDLTTGHTAAEGFQHPTGEMSYAYQNLVRSFSRPPVAIFYMVAMLTLCAHLAHGLWTVVNDLGVTGHRLRKIGFLIAGAIALIVLVCNASIPFFVWIGVIS